MKNLAINPKLKPQGFEIGQLRESSNQQRNNKHVFDQLSVTTQNL